jgi:predicted amidohydrolase
MSLKVALANLRYPATPDESVQLTVDAIAEAGRAGAAIVCFPECFVPGYRWPNVPRPAPNAAFLEAAWARAASAAREAHVAVVLGTERVVEGGVRIAALVIGPDGATLGFQDKVQLDPSEEATYSPGQGRNVFRVGDCCFGVAICHEGFRYPETVRAAARQGAQLVFHPHFDPADPQTPPGQTFLGPERSFHEKAMLCRAAENTCYFASVNCAGVGSATTSAVIGPDGVPIAHQPYGQEGLLLVDIDLSRATRLLASRYRPQG